MNADARGHIVDGCLYPGRPSYHSDCTSRISSLAYRNAIHGKFQFDDDIYISEGAQISDPVRLFVPGRG